MPTTFSYSLSLILLAVVYSNAESFDHRDFAIDTYYPKPNEVRLAEESARRFRTHNAERYGSHPVYLAVETSKIFGNEISDLYAKLINSETTASFFARSGARHLDAVDLKGIMIFNIRTGHFVSARGYVSVDTPQRGRVARFGAYIARYIGTGKLWHPTYSKPRSRNAGDRPHAPSDKQRAIAQERVRSYLAAVRDGRRPAATRRYIAVETLRPAREWPKARRTSRLATGPDQPLARMAGA